MMWQERQNLVVFECSSCAAPPIPTHKTGSANRTRKAIIFPPRVAVSPGRNTINATRIVVRAITETIRTIVNGGSLSSAGKKTSESILRDRGCRRPTS
jgi:hypothetical protein